MNIEYVCEEIRKYNQANSSTLREVPLIRLAVYCDELDPFEASQIISGFRKFPEAAKQGTFEKINTLLLQEGIGFKFCEK